MSLFDIFHKEKETIEPIENTTLYRAYYSGTKLKHKTEIVPVEDVVEFRYPYTMTLEQVYANVSDFISSNGILVKDFVLKRIDE